jgi:hypothetical protein
VLSWATGGIIGCIEESALRPDERVVDDRGFVAGGRLIIVDELTWADEQARSGLEQLAAHWTARAGSRTAIVQVPPSTQDPAAYYGEVQAVRTAIRRFQVELSEEGRALEGVLLAGWIPVPFLQPDPADDKIVDQVHTADGVYAIPSATFERRSSTQLGAMSHVRLSATDLSQTIAVGRLTIGGPRNATAMARLVSYVERINAHYQVATADNGFGETERTHRAMSFVDSALVVPGAPIRGELLNVGELGLDVSVVRDPSCDFDQTTSTTFRAARHDSVGWEFFTVEAHAGTGGIHFYHPVPDGERCRAAVDFTQSFRPQSWIGRPDDERLNARFFYASSCDLCTPAAWLAPTNEFELVESGCSYAIGAQPEVMLAAGGRSVSAVFPIERVIELQSYGAGPGLSTFATALHGHVDQLETPHPTGTFAFPYHTFSSHFAYTVYGDPFVETGHRIALPAALAGAFRPESGADFDALFRDSYAHSFSPFNFISFS